MYKYEIVKFISNLFDPDFKSDKNSSKFSQNFCDELIRFGSSHLILPSIFAALTRKSILHLFPTDLVDYLKEISKINTKRNELILNQINFISSLFKRKKINHVFLKGSALLITKPYDVLRERMIGDIDILVSKKDLYRAENILINEGFSGPSERFLFSEDLLPYNKKHLKRLTHNEFIAAVEIHRRLFDIPSSYLNSSIFLKNKILTKDGFYTPTMNNIWKHAVLNWQYNDYGMKFNYLSFRTIIDVIHTEPRNIKHILKKNIKPINNFYNLLSLHFDYPFNYNFHKLHYILQLRSYKFYVFNRLFIKLIVFKSLILTRLKLFIKSKKYRSLIIGNIHLLYRKLIRLWSMIK